MDVSNTNLMLDTSICGTSFFERMEYILRVHDWLAVPFRPKKTDYPSQRVTRFATNTTWPGVQFNIWDEYDVCRTAK